MKQKLLLTVLAVLSVFTTNAFADSKAVEGLNELLRGERSAVETYQQAMTKVGKEAGADSLKTALDNHKTAVADISSEIVKLGGKPVEGSGAWGAWASTVTGTAKLFGDSAALKALKEGEEHGVKDYQEILENTAVPERFKAKVRDDYLPQQQQHIAAIDGWLTKLD